MIEPTIMDRCVESDRPASLDAPLYLTDAHRHMLEVESAIAPHVIAAREYQSVDLNKAPEYAALGWKSLASALPGLEVPMYGVTGHQMPQIRPDEPKTKAKYLCASGEPSVIDANPLIRQRLDGYEPLWIVEGVKKADSAISQGLCCVALIGVWNWRGRNALGGKTVLPDWDYINLDGRTVYLAFDSDWKSNTNVAKALTRLRTMLIERGARVETIDLSQFSQDGEKVGLDDFFAAGGTVDQLRGAVISLDAVGGATAAAKDSLLESAVTEIGKEIVVVRNASGDFYDLRNSRFIPARGIDHVYGHLAPHVSSIASRFAKWPGKRVYNEVTFQPGLSPEQSEEKRILNTWAGWGVEPVEGDIGPFLELVHESIAAGRDDLADYAIKWIAHLVQKPRELPGTVLNLVSPQEGTGKNSFLRPIEAMVGAAHYRETSKSADVFGRFNGMLHNALVVNLNEATWGGDKQQEGVFKALVTDPKRRIELKGRESFEVDNYLRLIVASNNAWSVHVGEHNRRVVHFDVSTKHLGDQAFWDRYHAWLENGGANALLHYLLHKVDLTGWSPRALPESNDTTALQRQSLDPDARFWIEFLSDGYVANVETDSTPAVRWAEGGPQDKAVLFRQYQAATRNARDSSVLYRAASRLGIVDGQVRGPSAGNGARPWCIRFKPLAEARAAAMKALGNSKLFHDAALVADIISATAPEF